MKHLIPATAVLVIATLAPAQHTVPASLKETLQRLGELVERYQRPGTDPAGINGSDVLMEAIVAVRDADVATWREVGGRPKEGAKAPQFYAVFRPHKDDTPEDRERAVSALREYEARGVFAITARLPGAMRAGRPPLDSETWREYERAIDVKTSELSDFSIFGVLLPDLAKTRSLARIEMARFALAVDAGDSKTAITAFEECLAMARLASHHGSLIERLVGISIAGMATEEALKALAAGTATAEMRAGWAAALDTQLPLAEPALTMEVERLSALSLVRWAYDEKDMDAEALATIESIAGGQDVATDFTKPGNTPATRDDAVAATNAFFDQLARYASTPRPERAALGFEPTKLVHEIPAGQVLLRIVAPAVQKSTASDDQLQSCVPGLRAVLALEEWRASRGSYPASLAELPGASSWTDPFSGRPVCYRLVDPNALTPRDGYVVYSTGLDGEDNGGKPSKDPYAALHLDEGRGFDFVFFPPAAN